MYFMYCMIVRDMNLLLTRSLCVRQSSMVQAHTCVLELRFMFEFEIELWNSFLRNSGPSRIKHSVFIKLNAELFVCNGGWLGLGPGRVSCVVTSSW